MLTKHILSLFFAVAVVCCFSSFNTGSAMPGKKEAPFVIVDLYQKFTVSGVDYNVYWQYNTAGGAITNVQVFLNDCTACLVTDVNSDAVFTQTGTFAWQTTSGSLTISTTCGIFVVTGAVISQIPYC